MYRKTNWCSFRLEDQPRLTLAYYVYIYTDSSRDWIDSEVHQDFSYFNLKPSEVKGVKRTFDIIVLQKALRIGQKYKATKTKCHIPLEKVDCFQIPD